MTLLMRESNQALPHQLTKMGGIPLVPFNTDWVRCRRCQEWMQFIGQIALEETAIPVICERKQLLLLLMCTNDPGMCCEWETDSGGNAAILVSKTNLTSLKAPWDKEGFWLEERALSLERCDDSADAYCELFNQAHEEVCGKIGGEPLWIQQEEIPTCRCGATMTFVAQLEHSGEVQFGDGSGSGYVFVCSVCQDQAKFFSQSS
jgi:hypothetical protein